LRRTVLHNASYDGNSQLVITAIASGAEVEAVDKKRQTALILSSRQGHAEVVAILLESKVSVDHTDDDGFSCPSLVLIQRAATERAVLPSLS
jgi:ankyrin repeat protein